MRDKFYFRDRMTDFKFMSPRYLLALLLILTFSSCQKDSFQPIMSAVVKGKVWVATSTTYFKGNGDLQYVGFETDDSRIIISLHSVSQGTFVMDSVNGSFIQYYEGNKLYEPKQGSGKLVISSTKHGVATGTFEINAISAEDSDLVTITDGSFDGFPSE